MRRMIGARFFNVYPMAIRESKALRPSPQAAAEIRVVGNSDPGRAVVGVEGRNSSARVRAYWHSPALTRTFIVLSGLAHLLACGAFRQVSTGVRAIL